MEIEPCRRVVPGQFRRQPLRQAVAPQRLGRAAAGGVKARSHAVDDRHGKQVRDAAPILPAVEAPQIVRAHDPDEPHPGAAAHQKFQGVVGVAGVDDRFETGHVDAGMAGELSRLRHALLQWPQPAGVLQRVPGRHQPPHPVELKPLHGEQARGEMRGVGRIEGAAEQADAHSRRMRGKDEAGT